MLQAAAQGDSQAHNKLLSAVYDDLRRMAAARMLRESPGQTLQATALVHETYLRLVAGSRCTWQNRAHFYAAAGQAMRRILVEAARRHRQTKRGGGLSRIPMPPDLAPAGPHHNPADALALDEVLDRLKEFDSRMCEIVTLRCFVGMSIAEIAQALHLSSRSVNRDWALAKAWLARELQGNDGCPVR